MKDLYEIFDKLRIVGVKLATKKWYQKDCYRELDKHSDEWIKDHTWKNLIDMAIIHAILLEIESNEIEHEFEIMKLLGKYINLQDEYSQKYGVNTSEDNWKEFVNELDNRIDKFMSYIDIPFPQS